MIREQKRRPAGGFARIKTVMPFGVGFYFARHLDDLYKRIILREVSYQGFYQASTNPGDEYSVDRVTPTMNVKDLGFFEVPTHI
jgi:hypothetical protein